MYTARVTVDYPQRLKPKQFAALPLIEKLARGRGKVHDHTALQDSPELLELVDRAHHLGAIEQVVVNFDADTGGNVDGAAAFVADLVKAFAHLDPHLGPDNLSQFLAENDGHAYAQIVVYVNGQPVDKRLAVVKVSE